MIFSVLIKILCCILIFILAAAVAVILILLLAPFYFKIKGDFHEEKNGVLAFKWLFIVFNAEYKDDRLKTSLDFPFKRLIESRINKQAEKPGPSAAKPGSPKKTADKPKAEKNKNKLNEKPGSYKKTKAEKKSESAEKPQNTPSENKKIFAEIMSCENKADIINCFVKNIKYIINKLNFKEFKINVRFGLEDPSLTGQISGLLYASSIALKKGISLEPDFTKAVFEAGADIEGRGNLLNIIIPAVKFILNRNVRKVLF